MAAPLGFQRNAFQRPGFQSSPAIAFGFPNPTDVRLGVQYGPTGVEYTGTLQPKNSQIYLRRR